MVQALSPAAYVYEGLWTNWAKGDSFRGSTLTLSAAKANMLTAVLALFVTMSGGQLWTIMRFALHQSRASKEDCSILHQQQQLILRNIPTDIASARLLSSQAWSCRKEDKKAVSISILSISLACIPAIFFIVAGVFSSNIANAGPMALSRSPCCGNLEVTSSEFNTSSVEIFYLSVKSIQKISSDAQLSIYYARSCCSSAATSSNCQTFQTPRLNWTVGMDDVCLFAPQICLDNSKTMAFKTSQIDSYSDLGINAAHDDCVTYRRVTQCIVLNGTSYVTKWPNESSIGFTTEIAYANYGYSTTFGTDHTYSQTNYANVQTQSIRPCLLSAEISYAGDSLDNPRAPTFIPTSPLYQANADLTPAILSYSGRYAIPVDDPWFSAYQLLFCNVSAPITRHNYGFDQPITTLACTEKHQFCIANGNCTALVGINQVQQDMSQNPYFSSAKQLATIETILRAISMSSIPHAITALGSNTCPLLAAAEAVSETHTLSTGLPPDQWQNESEFFHAVSMAHLQRMFQEYMAGQVAAQVEEMTTPTDAGGKWLCQNLIVRNTAFQSFSVLAVALMTAFGTLIIAGSLNVEELAHFVQSRLKGGVGRKEAWDEDDLFGGRVWEKQKLSSKVRASKCSSSRSVASTADSEGTRAGEGSEIGFGVYGQGVQGEVLWI